MDGTAASDGSRGLAARFNRLLMIGAAVAFIALFGQRTVALIGADEPGHVPPAPPSVAGNVSSEGAPVTQGSAPPVAGTAALATAAPAEPPAPSLETLFGSRIMLASAVAPGYLVTEDRRRHDAGATLAAGYRLEAVTLDDIVVERGGRRTRVELGAPSP